MATEVQKPPAGAGGTCMPCCGRGVVYAIEGGRRREVTCPWCNGSGVAQPEVDAQARWQAKPPPQRG